MSLAQSLEQAFIYVVGIGVLHFLFFLTACWMLALSPKPQWGVWRRKIGRLALFLGLLLMAGAVFDGFWCSIIYDRLYFCFDPICEFTPYLPTFGASQEHLLGSTTDAELLLVWLFFALGTWGTTIFLYRSFRHVFGRELAPA
jgi:hypothetical protein